MNQSEQSQLKQSQLKQSQLKQSAPKWRNLRLNLRNKLIIAIGALVLPSSAFAGGLSKAKTALETTKSELLTVMPVIAVIALIILAIGYATKSVEKETFYRWGIGIIIVGSATEITRMIFS